MKSDSDLRTIKWFFDKIKFTILKVVIYFIYEIIVMSRLKISDLSVTYILNNYL